MTSAWRILLLLVAALIGVALVSEYRARAVPDWSPAEIAVIASLSLDALPELPPDPSNAVADDPRAIEFGFFLFHDTRLSADGLVSCATCHQPGNRFSDGLKLGQGIGMSKRNTPSIVASAYSPWQYWDGRRDSQWSQALSPLEDPAEHGFSRQAVERLMASDLRYLRFYESLFGALPTAGAETDRVFANTGKAIAAFERTLLPSRSRFEAYATAVLADDRASQASTFDVEEARGLQLFIGKANCTQCHNGPLLTNHEFHNTGVISSPGEVPDKGRSAGVREVINEPFNCRSNFSDDPERRCAELDFVRTGAELIGSMKTPSLRNLHNTEPYMHKGQLATLSDVLQHYNEAPESMIGHNEAKPLGLSRRELRDLEAFLRTLAAPVESRGVFAP